MSTIHIGNIKTDRFWVQCPDGRMLQIDTDTKNVLERLANREQPDSISDREGIDEEDIIVLIEALGLNLDTGFSIVDHAQSLRSQSSRRWLRWGIILALASAVVSILSFMSMYPFSFVIGLKEQWMIAGMLTLSVLIHELGHLLMMPRHHHISVGMQWSGPIPLISIICNEAWKLSKWQRMRINLAGFVADALVAGVTALIGILMPSLSPWIWTFLFVHLIRMVFALWPFLPGDGYWVLVDLFDYPNLWGNALDHLKQRKVSWLSFYALGRLAFLGFIWFLYVYVLYMWGTALLGRPIEQIFFFILHPAPLLILLNIVYLFVMLGIVCFSKLKK